MSEGPVPEEQRSWMKRNCWWWIPLVFCLFLAVFFGMGVYYVHEAKQSVPYLLALELVQADQTVKEKLGEPVNATWRPPDGEQRLLETGSGTAVRKFDVVGSKGEEAQVSVEATCERFLWTLDKVEVRIGNRQSIRLELPPEGDPRRTRKEVNKKNLVDPYAN